MSDSSAADTQERQSAFYSPEDQDDNQTLKRKASKAGLDGPSGPLHARAVKRRASKACQCCRARKVRCNVTEHGAPCTNCRLDEVDCIVSESRRKNCASKNGEYGRKEADDRHDRKWSKDDELHTQTDNGTTRKLASASRTNASNAAPVSASALDGLQVQVAAAPPAGMRTSASRKSQSHDLQAASSSHDEHVPHSIYQSQSRRLTLGSSNANTNTSNGFSSLGRPFTSIDVTSATTAFPVLGHSPGTDPRSPYFTNIAPPPLPYFIKPLPERIGPDDAAYLGLKGALTVPPPHLRNELLKAYIEFVHPFMPLLDLYEFVMIVESGNGTLGRISLILFQAVMFAGSAFCNFEHLRNAGYHTRKEARKDFFQKTRLLYDFDYEQDRLALVQSLLLLTYYYETPDGQKDTWHWMGVATSVAQTIGLHKNPAKTNLGAKKTKLWKRIWWSLYMRDRLIALGMRRPTRVKEEDYDVPMLTVDDFDIHAIPDAVTCVPPETLLARNVAQQRTMAIMCVEKTRLCLCISHVLSKQYRVLNNNQGLGNDRTTMMLLPKQSDPETSEIKACDAELQKWLDELPEEARYKEEMTGNPAVDLQRTLLHMVFFTTVSALHRPQVLPAEPTEVRNGAISDLLEDSRLNVRRAATAITAMAHSLDSHDLVRYLPTTGVTVLLPAIIIHLLDIKSSDEETRRGSLKGFCQCMAAMGKLRDIYAAADYSTAFLEAAIRKAGIQIAAPLAPSSNALRSTESPHDASPISPDSDGKPHNVTSVKALVDAGRRMEQQHSASQSPQHNETPAGIIKIPRTMTPPPDMDADSASADRGAMTEEEMQQRLQYFLAATPPDSDQHSQTGSSSAESKNHNHNNGIRDGIAAPLMDASQHKLLAAAAAAPKTPKFQPMTGIALDLTSDSLFPLFQSGSIQDFDDSDFNDLLNLDAMGEGFSFEEGLEAAVRLDEQGIGGGLGEGWGF